MSHSEEVIRVGLIGANPDRGWASRSHIPALMALPEFEISAVCTTREESCQAAARLTGAGATYTNPEAMVEDPNVDVVSVVVKVPDHHHLVMEALKARKHVYCEWPLGVNSDETKELADAAEAAGVVSMVGLQAQAAPAVERARVLIAEGFVGRVMASSLTGTGLALGGPRLSANMPWAADNAMGASVLTIPAAHAIDALFSCVGEPTDVIASIRTQTPIALDAQDNEVEVTAPDQVVIAGTLDAGGAYSVHVQGGTVGSGFAIGIYGSDGMLVVSTPGQGVQHTELTLRGARRGDELSLIDLADLRSALPAGPAGNIAVMYRRLAHAIRTGEPAYPDFAHAVRRYRFLDTAVTASDSGARQVAN